MRRIARIKDNDKLQKAGLYLSKYKEKWNRSMMNYEEEQVINWGVAKMRDRVV
jgi:hypothetical protein